MRLAGGEIVLRLLLGADVVVGLDDGEGVAVGQAHRHATAGDMHVVAGLVAVDQLAFPDAGAVQAFDDVLARLVGAGFQEIEDRLADRLGAGPAIGVLAADRPMADDAVEAMCNDGGAIENALDGVQFRRRRRALRYLAMGHDPLPARQAGTALMSRPLVLPNLISDLHSISSCRAAMSIETLGRGG